MPWTTTTTRSTGFLVTAAVWNNEHVDNMNFLKEVAYAEVTANTNITATTVGTAQQIVSAGAITYEAVPHMIEFWCQSTSSAAVTNFLILRDGTTVIGTAGRGIASQNASPFYSCIRRTPTAASHTYNFASYNGAAGTWSYNAGSGGTAGDDTTRLPCWIRVFRVPT